MSFSLSLLFFVVISYLIFLFATAYVVERGWLPKRWVKHPAIYTLSLGIYASAWVFYGSVGMASHYGYGFLTYYLGVSAAFALSPMILKPILRITHQYQLSSLADLLALRFRSRLAGILVTLFTLFIVVPMLTLQISSIADTLHLLNNELPTATLAFAYSMVMLLFAILFGARHVSPREKHEGLVFAMAIEAILKLVAILILGAVILWQVFAPEGGLQAWLETQEQWVNLHKIGVQEGPWRTLLMVFFAATFAMPHMFHMVFTENLNTNALKTASWGFPLFMLLMSLSIMPIYWAGIYLNVDTSPEYYALGIGLALESTWLSMLVFIGGLAAASGIIIVMTLATASMCLNHLVLPVLKPHPKDDFYRWLLNMRRYLLAAILLLSYAFYSLAGSNLDLNRLGMLAFAAALQLLPGILALLYWPRANRQGFVVGLVLGMSAWAYSMLLPFISYHLQYSSDWILDIDEKNWYLAALVSIGVNVLALLVISVLTRQKESEQVVAAACILSTLKQENRHPLMASNTNEIINALSKPLGRYVAEREVYQALQDLELPSYEDRPYALRRVRNRLEVNLSGLMGPTIAHDIVGRYLPFKETAVISDDAYQVEHRLEGFHDRLSGLAGELDNLRRYHHLTLERLPLGVCSLADDGEVMLWNQAMESLTRVNHQQVTGLSLSHVPAPWANLLQNFVQSRSMHDYKQRVDINGRPHWFNLHKSIIQPSNGQPGGIVLLMEDQTETQMLADELMHSERLASIGRLAAGVAHEIGNPVTAIDCLAQNMHYETDNPELLEMAALIQQQTRRITRIVQSLMNFSHAGNLSTEHESVQIWHVVEEAMQLLRLSKRSQDIEFVNQCAPDLYILGDLQRVAQVFVNLLSNARDASQPTQQITVSTEADKHQVIVNVCDQGHGIPESAKEQLFEPFFTTKEVGKGTGLGLALVYSIVEEHYGQVQIESPAHQGRGTCVKVSLPRYHPLEHSEFEA